MTLLIRDAEDTVDPSFVQFYVFQLRILISFQFALVTTLLYDTVINIDKEAKYFWSAPRKFLSIVYFTNRYVGIIGAISLLFTFSLDADLTLCNFSGWTRNIANWITIVLIDYILMLRVLALYSHGRKISVILKTLMCLAAGSRLGVMIYGTLYQQISVVNLTSDTVVCTNVRIVTRLVGAIDWAIPLVFGVILMGLALYKGAEFWRTSNGVTGLTLVKILVLDQFFYFLFAVSCCAVNIVLLQVDISNIYVSAILGTMGSPTLLCVLGCRLLVHLKEAMENGINAGTSYRLKTMSDLAFESD